MSATLTPPLGILPSVDPDTGGTSRDEFEAAIKSVTSSTTVGAVFLYDTRNDSDGGAWRKKARGSWYYETLNTCLLYTSDAADE